MPTPQQIVDGYLGQGWYDDWNKMEKQTKDERGRFDRSRKLTRISEFSPLYERIQDDLDVLDSLASDYRQGLTLIIHGRRVVKDKAKAVRDLDSLALSVVEDDNDMLEALFTCGLAAAWVFVPFALLQARSQEFLDILDDLKEELREAVREVGKAAVKQMIHGMVNAAEMLVPELSLTARAAIFLGDIVLDKALGPPDPATAQKYTGIVTPGVKQFSEAVHHIEEYGETTRELAKKTGHMATAATFYFDMEEIGEATERVDKIEELIEKAKRAYDSLVAVIEKSKPQVQQFLFAFERGMQTIADIREATDEVRNALKEDMARAGYDPRRDMSWPTIP